MMFSGMMAQETSWAWTMTAYAAMCAFLIPVVIIIKIKDKWDNRMNKRQVNHDDYKPLMSEEIF